MSRRQKSIKEFTAYMDTDSPNEVIHKNSFRSMWNCRLNGPKGNERMELVPGNRLLPGQDALPDVVGKTLRLWYDAVYARKFIFNWNASGNHAIYIYNTLQGTFQTLIKNGSGTDGDILGFTADGTINDVGIIYRDPADGDLLCFLDCLGRPTKLNIQRYLANTYPVIKRPFINVIKAPPTFPPWVVYENDTTVNANNCLNALFTFATAYGYDDNDRSALSSGSRLTLPRRAFDNTSNIDKSVDARIAVFFNTGDVNVKQIRLYMKQTQNGSKSDYQLVDVLDKQKMGLFDNTIYKYLFFNNGNYTTEDVPYTTLDFDRVPDVAATQAILNGNRLAYGNITEGQNWFKTTYSENLTPTAPGSNVNGFLFFASTNGVFTGSQPHVNMYIAGGVANDGSGLLNPASNLYVSASSDATNIGFNIANGSRVIQTILTALKNAAISAGWTFVSQGIVDGMDYLEMYYPTGNVILKSSYYTKGGTPADIDTRPVHFPQSGYAYGIVYYDINGKNIGVMTDITANINTLPVGAAAGFLYAWTAVLFNLNGIIPPAWAVSYAIVRTDTLSYTYYLDWVSARAFSNASQLVDKPYAYLGISNIDDYNANLLATDPVIKYGFRQGDRVRITAINPMTGGVVSGLSYDYPIISQDIDPVINGAAQTGRFLKIAYPTADIGPNLQFDANNVNFQNYSITIYNISDNATAATTPSANTGNSGNVFYEVGYKFGIGNPGTNQAYHFGNTSDNQVMVQDGDVFFRPRTDPAGSTFYFYSDVAAFSNRNVTLKMVATPNPAVSTTAYQVGAQASAIADPVNPGVYPTFGTAGGLVTAGVAPLNIRLRGSFQVSADGASWVEILCKIVGAANTITTPFILQHSDGIGAGASTTITFDGTVVVPGGSKLWLLFGNGTSVTNLRINGFMLRMDIIRNVQIMCFDKSYSDTFNLATNSDNRPNVEDRSAKRLRFGTRYRWSQEDQLDSDINGTCRFYFVDSDETVKSYGDIMKLSVLGKLLHVFHYRKCGTVGIFQKWIKNNSGQQELIVNDTIIEKNNIRYEVYEGGCGNQPGSVVISNYAHYFADPVKGYNNRWSNDGVIAISLLYKAQTWAGTTLPKYLGQYAYQFGGNAKVFGTFLTVSDNNALYLLLAQGGQNAAGDVIDGRIVVFDESDNAFEGFLNVNADQISVAENTLYSSYNGKLYIHDNTTPSTPSTPGGYAKFFGVNYPASIDMIFNESTPIKKTFLALGYQSNKLWSAPNNGDVSTSFINPQTNLQQISRITNADQSVGEGMPHAAFLRDANSMLDPAVAIWEGDYLKGNWLEINLQYTGGDFAFLYAPYIIWAPSPRN
jgi:hypothetical protein